MRSSRTATRGKPKQQRRPSTARNKIKKTTNRTGENAQLLLWEKDKWTMNNIICVFWNNFVSLKKPETYETAFPVIPWFWINREVFWDGKFKCSCFDMETSIISSLSRPIKYPSPFYNFRKSLELAFLPASICKGCTWLGFDSGEIILKGELGRYKHTDL